MLTRFIAAFFLVLAFSFPAMADESVYQKIVQQPGWLNTSRALTQDDLKGRIILLDFWTYCCINCIQVMPDLRYLEDKFGDDLTVIGVHSAKFKNEGDSENIRQAILRNDLRHPVVNDFNFATWKAFDVHAWPTFVLIAPNGAIEKAVGGEGHRAELESAIEGLRSRYAGSINKAALPMALEKNKQPETVLSFPTKLASFASMSGIAQNLVVADTGHHRVLTMQPTDNGTTQVDTIIGSGVEGFKDGSFKEAQFNHPQGVLASINWGGGPQLIYIADTGNHALRVADLAARTVTTLAGNGTQGHDRHVENKPGLEAQMASPWDIAFYPDKQHVVVTQAGLHQLWSYNTETKTVSAIAGSGSETITDGAFPGNALAQPSGVSALDGVLYFIDAETSSLRMMSGGNVKTLIGTGLFDFGFKNGVQGVARMQHPLGLVATAQGEYVADAYNHSIRLFNDGRLSTFAGHGERGHRDGPVKEARFNEPNAVIAVGKALYVADTNNNAIRVIEGGKVSTLKIQPPASADVPEFSKDALPNLSVLKPQALAAGKDITVRLGLQAGWHINADAPSSLALFAMTPMPLAVVSFDKQALQASHELVISKLEKGEYRLQGTVYYCADAAGSQCLLKSFDVEIRAGDIAQASVMLPLN